MIVGITGFSFSTSSGNQNPSAGTILSTECTYADGYDYQNNYYEGNWNYSVTRADGLGGSTTSVEGGNQNGCWHPSGWVYSSSNSDLSLNWSHGPDIGNFVYGSSSSTSLADGVGGSYESGGDSISATNGQLVNSYQFTQFESPYHPMTSYLRFSTADNQLHETNFITAGVELGYGCSSSQDLDASNTEYTVPYGQYTYADGNGGTYGGDGNYNAEPCGFHPSGFYTTYSETLTSLSYNDQNNDIGTFTYGKSWAGDAYDGYGNTNYQMGSELWYSSGYVFYSYYDEAGQNTVYFAFDGSSGYYNYSS